MVEEPHLAQPPLPQDQHHNKPAQQPPPPTLLREQTKPNHLLLLQPNSSKGLKVQVSSDRWLARLRKIFSTPLATDYTNRDHRGVAVGSSIGHAIGGFFGGGSSQPAAEQQQDNSVAAQDNQAQQNNAWGTRSCEVDAKQFTKCLDENQGNMQICGWYLEQLVSLA